MAQDPKVNGSPVIVWFRRDLRLADNGALAAALRTNRPVVPLFVLDPEGECPWATGGAGRWWLHHSLAALGQSLAERGARLTLRRGDSPEVLASVARETGADTLYWNRCYQPVGMRRGALITQALRERGVRVETFPGALLAEPSALQSASGGPYKVFTPFWRALAAGLNPGNPDSAPGRIPVAPRLPVSDDLADWGLLQRRPDWAGGLAAAWTPGEAGARARLDDFLGNALSRYRRQRDRPDLAGTSRLSPHLHWGEITPRQVWSAVAMAAAAAGGRLDSEAEAFHRELAWRDFSHHLLYHWPDLAEAPWRREFERFPWQADEEKVCAWRRGLTGYPIVDAGMRELWTTGWMHNRVRMIVASFLVKDLLIPWQTGEAWFWDTLVDADVAQNAANWQWVAGSGADAAPYFRIFNPSLQARKFDPKGAYIRTWVPEIAGLPDEHIHEPRSASAETLAAAGVRLGETYPAPIVDHATARASALAAYQHIKGKADRSGAASVP